MALTTQKLVSILRKNPVGLGCGVLTFGLLVFTYLRMDAEPEAENELREKQETSERYAANIKNAAQLKEQLATLDEAFKKIDARIIKPAELATNLQFFYKIEAETGTKLLELKQNPAAVPPKDKKPAYLTVPFSVLVQGDYPQLMAFLRAAESNSFYCRINAATMIKPQGAAGGEEVQVERMSLQLNLELLGHP